ncbi:retropepsin-like aspartic protease [Altererythrobacter sp. Root672]|uniref:retropepsin-like aspartic protease n=1 Tax=Altererythrobacter sp. Root672 TaxID=1736584 RepID=UPI000A7AC8EE|nr:retropepsin-like aspartic protease [Altererythrobacter sp. Root672]
MIRSLGVLLFALAVPAAAEPLAIHNGRLFVDARVNGVETEALLDSAAEATLIDPEFARRANISGGTAQTIRGSGGSTSALIVEGVQIEVLGLDLRPEVVVVTDLSELSKRLIKRPTNAVIGREFFDAARVRIDIGGGSIVLASRDDPPPGRELPLTAHAGVEALPVVVGGQMAQAEFDLGNGSEVLISRALADKLKLAVVGQKAGGGIGGEVRRDIVVIPLLEVAGTDFREVRAAVDDQPSANDLNLGTSILRHFLITADFKDRRVWLEPRKG